MVCPKRICKSAVLNTLKSIQISTFSETNKRKQKGVLVKRAQGNSNPGRARKEAGW
jgi:hypothetical protein